jgi:hypothetical protein
LTQGDTPWSQSSFSDQFADKFYQQVIDNEQKNSLNTKSDHSSDIKVDLVEQYIPKLSYFDPSDAHDTNVKGKYANLVFHLNTIVMKNANDVNQLNKDSFSTPHDVIQHTLRQTAKLAKSPLSYETSSQKSVSNAKTQKVK